MLLGVTLILKHIHFSTNQKRTIVATQAIEKSSEVINPTPGVPVHITIPSINVSADVEQVGLDTEGRMDIPSKEEDTAWFDLGFRPGQAGNAVIDGHLDQVTGAPSVFWNLKNLVPGNTVTITDAKNETYTFIVTKQEAYDFDKVPMQQVFGSSDSPHLNLITCNGTWDRANKNYSQRIVVYTDLKQERL